VGEPERPVTKLAYLCGHLEPPSIPSTRNGRPGRRQPKREPSVRSLARGVAPTAMLPSRSLAPPPQAPSLGSPVQESRDQGSMMRPARARKPDGYLLGSYRIATAPDPNYSRLTSFKSTGFDSPANNVGPWPASLGCTTNSYSSINPSSANASGSFTPPTNSPLPDSPLSC